MKKVKTYPDADIGLDHVPVVMNIRLQLKVLSKTRSKVSRDLEMLKDEKIARRFSDQVCNIYHQLDCEEQLQFEEGSVENMWTGLKSSIEEAL